MPLLPPEKAPVRDLRIVFPSTRHLPPDQWCRCWGPGRPDLQMETEVRSRSSDTVVNMSDRKTMQHMDLPMMRYMALHLFLEHASAGWDLHDDAGRPLERKADVIDNLYKTNPTDMVYVMDKVCAEWFPEMFGDPEETPNTDRQAGRADSPGDTPSPVSSTSDMKADPAPVPSVINGTRSNETDGSAVTPLASPSPVPS